MADEVYLNDKRLKDLIRMCKKKIPFVKVGILGKNNSRKDGTTNAEVGAAHEFGTHTLPVRSFLRMPLTTELNKALESSGVFTREALDKVAKEKSFNPYVKKIAVIAEGVVQEAFATGGFGQWAPWKPGYENNTGQILVDSQQLRNSITATVEGGEG